MTHLQYQFVATAESIFWAVALALAFQRGDRAVRTVALISLVTQAGAWLPWLAGVGQLATFAWADAVCFIAVLPVVLRHPRPWLVWYGVFQLAVTGSHLAKAMDAQIKHLAYATAVNSWTQLATAALLWGAMEADALKRARTRESVQNVAL